MGDPHQGYAFVFLIEIKQFDRSAPGPEWRNKAIAPYGVLPLERSRSYMR
jgi:hypothetical protein